jgi:uncharacterized protein YlzI (FlbEa/FlbD family)
LTEVINNCKVKKNLKMIYSLNDYPKEALDVLSFQKLFNAYNLDIVYYPCSCHHAALFLSLKNSRVIHVDMDKNAVETLKSIKAEAYAGSVLDFNFTETIGKKANLLYILNPQIIVDATFINNCLDVSGYCVCNNYHDTAEQVESLDEMKALGVMYQNILVKESVSEILTKVKEFKNKNPSAMFTPFMDHRFIFQKIK